MPRTGDDTDEKDRDTERGGRVGPSLLPRKGGKDRHRSPYKDNPGPTALREGESLAEEEEGQHEGHGDDDLVEQVLHRPGRVCAAHGRQH